MLIYPMLLPALAAAMQLTGYLVTGTPITKDNISWLQMLAGFDVMFTAVSLVLIEHVLVG